MEDLTPTFAADLAAELPVVFEHQVRVEEIDAATVPLLAGELEALRDSVSRSLPAARTALVVLDLGRVRFFGAAGLRCLLATTDQLAAAGHRTIVTNACPVVAKVIALDSSALLT